MNGPRLVLAPDAYYAQTPEGVHLMTHRTSVTLTGRSIYQWVDRLVPHLDGRLGLAELTASLDADRGALVANLIATLVDRGVVAELEGPRDPDADGDAETRLVAAFRGDAAAAVARHRATPTTVLGTGRFADAVAGAAAVSGLTVGRAGPVADGHLVLAVSDHPDPEAAARLERLCAARDVLLAQAVVVGDEVWCVPAGRVDVDRGGWSTVWRRLAAADPTLPATGAPLDGTAATVAAAQIVQDAFRRTTGVGAVGRNRVTVLRADTLARREHLVLPHPFDLAAGVEPVASFVERTAALAAAAPLDDDEFSRRAATLVDARLGVLGELTEDGLAQLPVHVSRTVVSDPVGLLGPAARTVHGAGPDFATARVEAVLRGVATYAAAMPDPRRMLAADGSAFAADGPAGLAALRRDRGAAVVHGLSLPDRRPMTVRADRVFTGLGGRAVAAAGRSWDEALTTGLLELCRAFTVGERVAPVPLDPAALPLDAVSRTYLALAGATGAALSAADITGALGVPTVAFGWGGSTAAVGCGCTLRDAVRNGLRDLLLHHQSRSPGQSGYAPAPPVGESGARAAGLGRLDDPHTAPTELARRLAAVGCPTTVVPLDHDPEVYAVIPHVVSLVVRP